MTQASRADAVHRVSEHVLHTRDDAGPRGTTDPQVPVRRAVVVVVVLTAGMHRESLPHATATTAATTHAACEMKRRSPHSEGEKSAVPHVQRRGRCSEHRPYLLRRLRIPPHRPPRPRSHGSAAMPALHPTHARRPSTLDDCSLSFFYDVTTSPFSANTMTESLLRR